MIVKNYKSNGEEITYTLDYDLFSVGVEQKRLVQELLLLI